jgi:hypothetical protein
MKSARLSWRRVGGGAGAVLLAAAALIVLGTTEGRAQDEPPNYVEIRGADSDGAYRYLEYGRGFDNGLVADFLYLGVPDQNELYAGLGYEIQASPTTVFLPILYAVAGREDGERGATLGAFISRNGPRCSVYAFLGHFHPIRGDVPRYTFLDSFDVTWRAGSWEFGPSTGLLRIDESRVDETQTGASATPSVQQPPGRSNRTTRTAGGIALDPGAMEGGWTWLAGVVAVRNDARGAWKVHLRDGSHRDIRVVRTFAF